MLRSGTIKRAGRADVKGLVYKNFWRETVPIGATIGLRRRLKQIAYRLPYRYIHKFPGVVTGEIYVGHLRALRIRHGQNYYFPGISYFSSRHYNKPFV